MVRFCQAGSWPTGAWKLLSRVEFSFPWHCSAVHWCHWNTGDGFKTFSNVKEIFFQHNPSVLFCSCMGTNTAMVCDWHPGEELCFQCVFVHICGTPCSTVDHDKTTICLAHRWPWWLQQWHPGTPPPQLIQGFGSFLHWLDRRLVILNSLRNPGIRLFQFEQITGRCWKGRNWF